MTTPVAKLKDAINEVRFNPAAVQRKVFDTLEEMANGEIDVVDPTNPFVFLVEASSVLTSAQMEEAENLTRQLYPSMAITEDELYLHMSDRDYIGRFSSPSRTTFTILLNKEELIKKAVDTGENNVKKIVIPRNTEFRVSDYTFTMEYPIELRVMGYGGLQVVYDVTKPSPLQTLESNIVDWSIVSMRGDEYIKLNIPVNQFQINTHYAHVTQSSSYTKTFTLEDKFYCVRAYRIRNKVWHEIRTTHTDQVFDPNDPTILLKVYENKLKISIPQVYITNKTLDTELRFDIYTTKGPLDIILDSYEINSFTANWKDIAKESEKYIAPLTVFSAMAVYSESVVTGGSHGLTFDQLRERVIMNALGNAQLPITDSQLTARLSNMGYQAIKDIDNVTNRIYLASRRLPPPKSGNTVGGAACMIGTLQYTFNDLMTYSNVIDNIDRITLTSDVLFYRENGVTRIVPSNQIDELQSLFGNRLIEEVNGNRFLRSPFHYVLDGTGNYFDTRAYYLDKPRINHREYLTENQTLTLNISTDKVTVVKRSNQFVIRVQTVESSGVEDIGDDKLQAQLSFRPINERLDVFMIGRLVDKTSEGRVYEFDIDTRFDINNQHHLTLESFSMFPDGVRNYQCELNQRFTLVYYVAKNAVVDTALPLNYRGADFLFTEPMLGVSEERIGVKFGEFLEGFWENSRTVVSSQQYLTHLSDIYDTYDQHVYRRDPITGAIDISLDDNGEVQYEILYRKGDLKLDAEGNPVIKHREGDPVLNSAGEPIVVNPRGMLREWDMFFYDARYSFATRGSDRAYMQEVPETLVNWLNSDLREIRNWALEQTKIYLYPLRTMGSAKVMVRDGEIITIDLEQSLKITFYMDSVKYDDLFTRQTLTHMAKVIVRDTFSKSRVTRNEIISKITASMGEDALAVEVIGLGGNLNLSALSLTSESERCSIRKYLNQTLEGGYEVIDDIEVNFIRHVEN